jgi:hypothetical protein
MTTTSHATDSAEAARRLEHLRRLGLAPEQVAERIAALRPDIEAGDGAAMLFALDQARAWFHAYDKACDILGDGKTADHLTHGWCDLMELIARAPACGLPAILAKAQLHAWTTEEDHGWAEWNADLARTLRDGVAVLIAAEVQRHA